MSPKTRFAPCPRSPNCVSSRSRDPRHRMEPLPFRLPPARVRELLLDILRSRPRTRILTAEELYLHATETSALLRFVDDVELEIDPAASVVHFRSASRVGYSDLGANRRRMEELRRELLRREEEEI